jgi:hypothetical protein
MWLKTGILLTMTSVLTEIGINVRVRPLFDLTKVFYELQGSRTSTQFWDAALWRKDGCSALGFWPVVGLMLSWCARSGSPEWLIVVGTTSGSIGADLCLIVWFHSIVCLVVST